MSVHPVRRSDGSTGYQVRWREPTPTGGKRNRARTFDRKRDADLVDLDVRRRQKLGGLPSAAGRPVTLNAWLEQRWAPEHLALLEPSTRELYRRLYARHLEHELGPVALADLTVELLRQWQARALTGGMTVDQVHKARKVLSSILTHAAESSAIDGNPLKLVRRPPAEHTDEVNPLAPGDVERIREELPLRDATIVSVLAYAGLRPGELRALRWTDIRDATILVQRGARPDGTPKSTKTKKARTVRLLAPLAEDLAAWRAAGGDGRSYVFPARAGGMLDADGWGAWRRDRWRPACARAKLLDHTGRAPRPYDLRHSFASLLIAEGRDVLDVARQLGHSPRETLETYGHVIDEYANRPFDQRPEAENEIRLARQFAPGSRDDDPPARHEEAN